jgi:membrane protein YqaA with SNARE-associated domain
MEELGQLVAGLEGFVRHYGAFAIMPILAIEAVGAPVPGESLLIFASVLAGRGEMPLPALLASAWLGSVVGDNLGYLIGRKLGRATVLRYGAKVGLTAERFSGIEATYIRYGYATVLFARFFSHPTPAQRRPGGNAGNVLVAFRVVGCDRGGALGHGLGFCARLFQRAPERHCRAGKSYKGHR